jgi:signal peptidase II
LKYFSNTLFLFAVDQVLKWYMSSVLPLCTPERCESMEVLPFFKLMVLHNRGAAFSFLADAGGWQRWFLVAVSSVVSVFVAVWLYRIRYEQKLLAVSLSFILGGALGNLIDRALQGYVVDFFVVYYHPYYFPAFNIADSAITVGAALMILDILIGNQKRHESE